MILGNVGKDGRFEDFASYLRNQCHNLTWVYTKHKQQSFSINKR